MTAWTSKDIPDQSGRRAVITGATAGLGFETALALAGAGAAMIVTGRNDARGAAVLARIRTVHPGADLRYAHLDVASLADIAAFADRLGAEGAPIDLLINNAGVLAPPTRRLTADGFEVQFGTNYLGHFALTARLLPLLRRGDRARVVNLASLMHRRGRIGFDDLESERAYVPWAAYAQSKLAMLMFAFELQRRSDANGWGIASLAAHPGWARTELFDKEPAANRRSGLARGLMRLAAPVFSQPAAAGAWPVLFAATAGTARAGGYYGPVGFQELTGPPGPAGVAARARDPAVGARLWAVSETLTGVRFGSGAEQAGASR